MFQRPRNEILPQSFEQCLDERIKKTDDPIAKLILELIRYHNGSEHLYDILIIYQFLLNVEKFKARLDMLERNLQDFAACLPAANEIPVIDGKFHIPHDTLSPYGSCYRILSGYLKQWGRQNGFKQMAKLIDVLSPQAFQSLLLQRSIFKDSAPFLDAHHGKWSHMIQWWCVIEENQHSKEFNLSHDPLLLFEEFGRKHSHIWDRVFDASDRVENFSSPEYVTTTIIEGCDRWPILSGTLCKQKFKMGLNPYAVQSYAESLHSKHADALKEKFVIRSL